MIGLAAGLLIPVAATGARMALGTVGMARDLAQGMVRSFIPGRPDNAGISEAGRAMGLLKQVAQGNHCTISEMQAEDLAFLMEKLAAFFSEQGLDFEEGFELSLEEDGSISIQHPEAETIRSWIESEPELEDRIQRAVLTATLMDAAERMQRARTHQNPYAQAGSGSAAILQPAALRIAADGVEIRPA